LKNRRGACDFDDAEGTRDKASSSEEQMRLSNIYLVVLLVGCGNNEASMKTDARVLRVDATRASTDMGVPQDAQRIPVDAKSPPSAPSVTPAVACDQYLACLAAAEPEAFPLAMTVYQPTGPCWRSEGASTNCKKACNEGFAKLANANQAKPECRPCARNLDPFCIDLLAGTYRCKGGQDIMLELDVLAAGKLMISADPNDRALGLLFFNLPLTPVDPKDNKTFLIEPQQGEDWTGCKQTLSATGKVLSPETFEIILSLTSSGCSAKGDGTEKNAYTCTHRYW
jgi:hypothetical protein